MYDDKWGKENQNDVYDSPRDAESMIRLLEGATGMHAFWHTCISSY